MTINLASEYDVAFQANKQFYSYTYELEGLTVEEAICLFSDAATQDVRLFWQTPDESVVFIGLGEAAYFSTTAISAVAEIRESYFYQQKPALLFGGFPFDEQGKSAPLWESLASGGFTLPKILLRFENQRLFVTLTAVKTDTFEQLEAAFSGLAETVAQLLHKAKTGSLGGTPVSIEQTELAVEEWMATVDQAVATIQAKETPLKKIVLARQLTMTMTEPIAIARVLANLRAQQPNTYVYCYAREGRAFIGATPERLLAATKDTLETAAVAGSIARGTTAIEDEQYGDELRNSTKNVHEHQIVVNRLTNQMRPFVQAVTVSPLQLLKNRDIQHLYATITGSRTPDGLSFIEMIKALHPTPALGGEPKQEAVAWIRNNEPLGRGMYGAPIGWLSLVEDGGEFAVGIRSAVISEQSALLYAGCGIVGDSVAIEEREETKIKFQPMKRGLLGDVTSNSHD